MVDNLNRKENNGELYEYTFVRIRKCSLDNHRQQYLEFEGVIIDNISNNTIIKFEDRAWDRVKPVLEYCGLIDDDDDAFIGGSYFLDAMNDHVMVLKSIKGDNHKYCIDFIENIEEWKQPLLCNTDVYDNKIYPFGIGGY
jgi:hypothetical protein